MVQPNQFLERSTLIECAGAMLEGLWHRGAKAPALLIYPPHPSRGSSMDSPVCAEVAFAVSRAGFATLRFNYRGAGASQGELDGSLERCVEDAAAALAVLRESVGEAEVAVAGCDFGAAVAVELARGVAEVRSVVAVAPRTGEYDFRRLSALEVPGLVVVGQRDEMCDRRMLGETCQSMGDELVVIPEADHLFSRGLSSVGKAVAAFLAGERVEVG